MDLKPTFDFSKVSRQWARQWAASAVQATKVQIALARPRPDTADYAALQAYYDGLEKALDESTMAAEVQAGLVAQVLTDVPREWLLPIAPAVINWSTVESLDYIQEAHYMTILEIIQTNEARRYTATREAQEEGKK